MAIPKGLPLVNEVLTWGALIIAGGSVVAVITFWMNLGSRLAKAEVEAESAKAAALAAHAEERALSSQIADHRERVARDVAVIKTLAEMNITTLSAAENRMASAVEQVTDRLDKLTGRIDHWLERGK